MLVPARRVHLVARDACSPNIAIDDDGRCCGHIDFASLGVADRWADLATGAEFFVACGVGSDNTPDDTPR